jgi:hypothetical protein
MSSPGSSRIIRESSPEETNGLRTTAMTGDMRSMSSFRTTSTRQRGLMGRSSTCVASIGKQSLNVQQCSRAAPNRTNTAAPSYDFLRGSGSADRITVH